MQALKQKSRMLVAMIALAATAGVASTAQAGDEGDTRDRYDDVVVTFSDLDLTSTAGNKVLYARLSNAAERSCGNSPATRDLLTKSQFRSCVDKALNRAVDEIGTRELQALHRDNTAHKVG